MKISMSRPLLYKNSIMHGPPLSRRASFSSAHSMAGILLNIVVRTVRQVAEQPQEKKEAE